MKIAAENRARVIRLDQQDPTMRGNAEPAADHIAAEDAARDAAMKRMAGMTISARGAA